MMQYKGYVGEVELDEEAGLLHGRVAGTRDVITFQGRTVAEVARAFRDSIDDYLEFCVERGEAPEKPYSGKFVARVGPELHRRAALAAKAARTSLNDWVRQRIEAGVGEPNSAGSPTLDERPRETRPRPARKK